MVGVDAGSVVAEAHVPRAVQDHGVKYFVHLALEHHERFGLGDRTSRVPLHKGLNQTLCFRRVGRVLLTHQLARDRAEVLLGHDLVEQCVGTWTVGPMFEWNDGAVVAARRRQLG